MRTTLIVSACALAMSTAAFAQVNQGQGGAPSPQSGGVMTNPRTNMEQGGGTGERTRTVAPSATTGTAPIGADRNPANGNAGKSGGEGGSGR
jgi:hypothetical protein